MSKILGFFPLLAFIIPLFLYLITLAPTYVATDSAEFALCMHYWGVCHPPGFGLYIALGHFFIKLMPVGTLIYKVNLLSAIFGAGTIFFVYLSYLKLNLEKFTAFGLSILLATSIIFWRFSVFADVFTFGAFLTSASLFFLFSNRRLLAFLFLGLSASHMYLTALALPIYIWYFWGSKKLKDLRQMIVPSVIFMAGACVQSLIFLRSLSSTPINWGHVDNFFAFFDYLRRKEFGSFFLIANEAARFNFGHFLAHWLYFFGEIFKNLPVFAIITSGFLIWGPLYKRKEFLLLVLMFFTIGFFQLLSLSTIDPADEIFEFDKFYVLEFVIFILISGLCIDFLFKNLLRKKEYLGWGILTVLILINLIIGSKINNFSKNYFTQNLVIDALSQLPKGSIGVTVDHPVYFGYRYEKEIENRFEDIEIVYFLNNNQDFVRYNPELFDTEIDSDFFDKVKDKSNINEAQIAVLELIAKNRSRDIYILQGSFEENFFKFLKPYIKPYGLWWKVIADSNADFDVNEGLFEGLKNKNIRKSDFVINQQKTDSLIYAVSYGSAGFELAKKGDFFRARDFFNRAKEISGELSSINNALELTDKAIDFSSKREMFIKEKKVETLMELATIYYSLGYFEGSVQVNEKLVEIDPDNAVHLSNLGSSYASLGQKDKASEYFKRALEIDPDLELAKKGLESLRVNN